MSILLTCPQGHQWRVPGDDPATYPTACPVCGLLVALPPAEAFGTTQTLGHAAEPGLAAASAETVTAALGAGSLVDGNAVAGSPSPPAGQVVVPGYEVMEELGRGGMAIVYKARQVQLNRLVALKMTLAGAHASDEEMARFQAEAEVLAQLHHPNIVPIYAVGEHAGQPWFALEYVNGGSLAQQLNGRPQPPRPSAHLVETLALAVHAAHQGGIIHRDLKPANVLLAYPSPPAPLPEAERGEQTATPPLRSGEGAGGRGAGCVPKISDFGLAKRLEEVAGQSQSGAIVGTPAYMAPEQAGGQKSEIGPAVDVWALGAILYELFTGRPPFCGETPLETLLQVVSADPSPPRRLQPSVPRDLETICLKCLRKAPRQRYPTALALAEDLRRFLDGKPIQARRTSLLERTGKWIKRFPAVAALLALLLAALAWSSWTYGPAAFRLVANRGQLVVQAENPDVEVILEQGGKEVAVLDLRTNSTLTLPAGDYDLVLPKEGHGLELSSSRITIRRNGVETVEVRPEIVGEVRRLTGHTGPIRGLAMSPDGRRALSASGAPDGDKTLRLWDLERGQELRRLEGHTDQVLCAAFSADGRRALSGGQDKTLRLWDANTGREVRRLTGHAGEVRSVVFFPDGRQALSAGSDKTLRLWNLDTGGQVDVWEGHGAGVTCLAVSADGRQVLSGGEDRLVRLWEAATGEELRVYYGHGQTIRTVAFCPDGRHILSAGDDRTLRLWDAASGRLVRRFLGHQGPVFSAVPSGDGRRLLSGSLDRTIRLWDLASGRELHCFLGHADGVCGVALAADGRRVLSGGGLNMEPNLLAGSDFSLRLWRLPSTFPDPGAPAVATAHEIRRYEGHTEGVSSVAISRDGRRILTSSRDNTVRLWDADSGDEMGRLLGHTRPVLAAVFSADGRRILSGSEDGSVRLWDADTGRELRRCIGHTGMVQDVALSADGRQALSACTDRTVRLWDLETGKELRRLTGHQNHLRRIAWSPDGRRALSCGADHYIHLWDLQSGKSLRRLEGHTQYVTCVAFSPDGRRALSSSHDQTVRLWDLDAGKELRRFEGHAARVEYVAFSPDGRCALSSGWDDSLILLWDVDSGQEIAFAYALAKPGEAKSDRPLGQIGGVAFCPGGFLSCGVDRTVRRWQLPEPGQAPPPVAAPPPSREEIQRFRGHHNVVLSTAFSPDGRYILSGSGEVYFEGRWLPGLDNSVRLWDAATGRLIRRFHGHTGSVFGVAFSSDGRLALSASSDRSVRIWNAATGQEVHRFTGHTGRVRCAALSADGQRLLTASEDRTFRLWEVKTGKSRVGPVLPGGIFCAAFSPDGRKALLGGGNQVWLWDVDKWALEKSFRGHGGQVRGAAFSPDGRRVYSCSEDGTLRQWDAATGQPRGVLLHPAGVLGLALSRDGRRAVTAGADHMVHLWDLETGKELHRFVGHTGLIHGVAISADGRRILSGSVDKTLRMWQAPDAGPARPDAKGKLFVFTPHPTVRLTVSQQGKPLAERTTRRRLELKPGVYRIELADKEADLVLSDGRTSRPGPLEFAVRADEQTTIGVIRLPPRPTPRIVSGWGEVADPDGDCLIKADKAKVTITVPGTAHDLSGNFLKWNAPRILQPVDGDFTLKVKVTSDFNPGATPSVPGKVAFHSAGILVWQNENHCLRFERNIWCAADGQQWQSVPPLEYWKDKRRVAPIPAATKGPFFKGRSTWLRLERHGKELRTAVSHDGKTWIAMRPVAADFPARVHVGVAAVNTSSRPFVVEFEEFQLTAGKAPAAEE